MSSPKKYSWILVLCTAALAVLVFFEPSYGGRFRNWLAARDVISADDPSLPAENQALQAQLAELLAVKAQVPQDPGSSVPAMVYSSYPFGFKNGLTVDAGSGEGVATGSAVTFQGIFIGTVQQVFPDAATVQTVFDPAFKLPVRIGPDGIDGLLVGGAYPKIGSIAKGAPVAAGDIVYAAAPGMPYGLPVADVNATGTSADNLFQEASLEFAYSINDAQAVLIIRE